MKLTLRLLATGLLGLGLAGLPGCADNNDKEVLQDTTAGGKKAVVPENAPKSPQEQYQQMNSQGSGTSKGYGAGNGPGGAGGGRK